jgi:fructokinase
MTRVICLGEALWDRLAPPGVPLDQVTTWLDLPGGAPANVACALAKLGDRSYLVGGIGADELGQELRQVLLAAGVDGQGLQIHPTAPTRQVQVLRSHEGDRAFGGFGGWPTEAFADAQWDVFPVDLLQGSDFVVLGTLGLAVSPSRDTTQRVVNLAQAQAIPLVVDVNWRPSFWPQWPGEAAQVMALIKKLTAQASIVKMAREEAELLYQTDRPLDLRAHLPQATGIIVTDGDRDCHYYLLGAYGTQPAFPVKAVDTTGAGDAFLAAVIHQLGRSPRPTPAEILRYGAAAGALTTLRPGAIASQPAAHEIEAFLARQEI